MTARVLVVDDLPENREVLVRRLIKQGYAVEEATGGRQALERIEAGGIDLVLLDIMMPDVDGLEVLRTVRRVHSLDALPVIMVTARDDASSIVEALEAGASDYVTKPVDALVLLARVRTQVALLAVRRDVHHERQRLRELVNELPATVAMWSGPEHRLELANARFQLLTGRAPARGTPFREALPELHELGLTAVLDRVVSTGTAFSTAALPLRVSGPLGPSDPVYLALTVFPMRDLSGAVETVILHATDVSELVVKTFQLQTVTEALSLFVETGNWRQAGAWLLTSALSQTGSPAGFIAVVMPGRCLRILAHQGLSLSVEPEADGASDANAEPGCPDIGADGLLGEALDGGQTLSCAAELRLRGGPAGRFDVLGNGSVLIAPVKADAQVVGLIAVSGRADAYTASDRAKLDLLAGPAAVFCRNYGSRKKLAVLEQQLNRARRMESVGKLAGGVAHDFNNNLTVIRGYADLLSERLVNDPELGPMLDEVVRAADRAAAVTAQLLAFGRKQMLRPGPIDLRDLVRGLSTMLGALMKEKVELELDLGHAPVVAHVDRARIEQAVLNLVENACEAMPGGGVVTVQTEVAELASSEVKDGTGLAAGRYARLMVSDTGPGMATHVASRCFEPFFTTKDVGMGPGLGLSVVEGVVTQSGGAVRLRTEPGQGARFELLLPLAAGAAAVPETPRAAESGRGTVLVVEDEAGVRRLVVSALQSSGYTVLSAGDADEAERIFGGGIGTVDLLVSDVMMPGRSGPELYRALVRRAPGLKVLFISGYAEQTIMSSGELPPDAPLLSKPFTPEALARRVRQVLRAEPPITG